MRDDVKYAIAVDKLEILLSNIIEELEIQLSLDEYGEFQLTNFILRRNFTHNNPGFRYCFEVMSDNNIWGYYFYDNIGRYRYHDLTTSLLSICNPSLYESGFSLKVEEFINEFGLEFQKYKFLEIAIDGNGFIERYSKLAKSKKYVRRKRIKERIFISEKHEKAFKLGSDRSEKHVSIYNKTQEIAKSNKTYINDFWKLNGLVREDDQSIDRVEGRFRTKALNSFTDDLTQLENPDYLASFFNEKLGDYILFKNEFNYKKSLINWNFFQKVKINKVTNIKASFSISRYKPVIRTLYEEYVVTNNDIFLESIVIICDKYKMDDWLINKFTRWDNNLRIERISYEYGKSTSHQF